VVTIDSGRSSSALLQQSINICDKFSTSHSDRILIH
jgi:hypothetical protein